MLDTKRPRRRDQTPAPAFDPEILQEILRRLVRVETRLVNLMQAKALDRDGHPKKGTV